MIIISSSTTPQDSIIIHQRYHQSINHQHQRIFTIHQVTHHSLVITVNAHVYVL